MEKPIVRESKFRNSMTVAMINSLSFSSTQTEQLKCQEVNEKSDYREIINSLSYSFFQNLEEGTVFHKPQGQSKWW